MLDHDYLSCTFCGRKTDVTATELAEKTKVRGRHRRLAMIIALCENWRCNACLDIAEREETP